MKMEIAVIEEEEEEEDDDGTRPPKSLGMTLIVMIPKIAHHGPSLIPLLPRMLPCTLQMLPILPQISPQNMDHLLAHKDFLSYNLPVLLTRPELLPGLVRLLAPDFPKLDNRVLDKMHVILPEFMLQLHLILPHSKILKPHIPRICLYADKMIPNIGIMLAHIEELKDDLGWLIDFAELDEFDDLIKLLPIMAPHVAIFRPYAPKLKKNIAIMLPYLPVLLKNIDGVKDVLPYLIDHIDSLLYNFGPMLPLADSLGILHSKTLMKMAPLVASTLPETNRSKYSVVEYTRVDSIKDWSTVPANSVCFKAFHKRIPCGGNSPKVFFVLHVKEVYYGEFRYSDLAKLHCELQQQFPSHPLRFPSHSSLFIDLESRKNELETFVQDIVGNPKFSKAAIVISRLGYRAKGKDSPQNTS